MSDLAKLIVHDRHPLNAEPPLDRLCAHYITPQEFLYVRTHGTIPQIDAEGYRLQVKGRATETTEYSLASLQAEFPKQTVMAALQCVGNRRADLQQVKPVSGEPWGPGAIGNALWTGVCLGDVLRRVGIEEADDTDEWHVAFQSQDEVEIAGSRIRYGVSIPLHKALSAEVLLAWKMNGEPLSREHGFPLRLIVPGYAGARSPKWLLSVVVQDHPSDNPIQQNEYKLFPPRVSAETARKSAGAPINEMPLNAAICEPAAFAQLQAGRTTLHGYAIAAGRAIARVDVSIDGGRSWMEAELDEDKGAWGWSLWRIEVELPNGEHELAVRAWDSAGQTQPANPEDVWNFKGYLSAAWHRVRVQAT
ncbi:MAG: molybdopterin oxidoreductase [Spartobacteria bacterium]|nr:molybdopterin oxidoreductase [Spartobacteria bacterium]